MSTTSNLNQATKTAADNLASVNHDLTNLHTSVMGPQFANATKELWTPELAAEIKRAMAGQMTDDKLEAVINKLINELIKPAQQQLKTQNRAEIDNIKAGIIDNAKIAIDIANFTGDTSIRRANAMAQLEKDTAEVDGIMKNMMQCRQQIDNKTKQHTADTINYDNLDEAGKQRHKDNKERIEDLNTSMKALERQLITKYDKTLGKNSKTTTTLKLPSNMEMTTGKSITDAFKMYLQPRLKEYYMLIPYYECISNSYDNTTGTYYEPPSILKNYDGIHEASKEVYTAQNRTLYCEILTQLKESGMSRITQEFLCGMDKTVHAKCGVDDGMMAFYCLLSKYGKEGSDDRNDLEEFLIQAGRHFEWGSPKHKIDILKPKLADIIRLNIPLKASLTLNPIIAALKDRSSHFLTTCEKYANPPKPNDCATVIEQLFAEVEKICEDMERRQGTAVWGSHHNTIDARQIVKENINKNSIWSRMGKGSKGKGSKGKDNKYNKEKGKGAKGKGKGKYKGAKGKGTKGKQSNHRHFNDSGICGAKDCWESTQHRFCLKHHKEAMDKGYVTDKDDQKYYYDKPKPTEDKKEKDTRKTYGFTDQMLHGMKIMMQHAMQTNSNDKEEEEQPNANRKRKVAFTAMQNKKTRSDKFLEYVSNIN